MCLPNPSVNAISGSSDRPTDKVPGQERLRQTPSLKIENFPTKEAYDEFVAKNDPGALIVRQK